MRIVIFFVILEEAIWHKNKKVNQKIKPFFGILTASDLCFTISPGRRKQQQSINPDILSPFPLLSNCTASIPAVKALRAESHSFHQACQ